ncbi:MAG TPA: hypothetical protein VFV38_15740 [Ktedonobacteraceae bacterium]|nr:hypothetical protein [Ktedonobacteraceae bacterium]
MLQFFSKGSRRGIVVPTSLLRAVARETLSFLSAVQVPQVLGHFGACDVQTSAGPLWLLTNGQCEDTGYWHPDVLRYHGESYQDGEDRYPLIAPEAQFIEPALLALPRYFTDLCLGYSAWWQARKWICPTLEYCYIPADPDCQLHGLKRENPGFWTRPDTLRAFVEKEAERLASLVRAVQGEVLLDLVSFSDRYVLHLLVPCEQVSVHFGTCEAWQRFLRALFPVTPPSKLVFLNTNCEQERGGLPELSNAAGKSYGASVYDLTEAPSFLSEDADAGELLGKWLQTQEAYLKAWGPGEAAAIYNARLACAEENLIPVNPVTRRYLSRNHHCNPFA